MILENVWFEGILDMIYPRCCPVCGEIVLPKGEKICPRCLKKLRFVHSPTCKCCGKEILSPVQEYCFDCSRRPKAFEYGMPLLNYEKYARRSVTAIKYKNKREYLDLYAELLCAKFGRRMQAISPDALVPVPIHKKKRRKRGFNQAEVLARRMGRILEIPVWTDCLVRTKNTQPQKDLSAAERFQNLKEAFAVEKDLNGVDAVVLIDDIYTTGATAQACTLALKGAGVKRVYLAVICIGNGER
ncbi:MAG: ComF family protein [bacterium]|nr:ComF family protein [bacterium]